jgi:hypothetical protein
VPNIFSRSFQAFQTLIRIGVIAFDVDPNLRRPSVVSDMDRRDTHQSDPRIGQFAFDQRFDLFAQSLTHPPTMIFQPALFHDHSPHQVKRMRISENRRKVLI